MRTYQSAARTALAVLAVMAHAAALGCGGSSSSKGEAKSPAPQTSSQAAAPQAVAAEASAAPALPPIPDTPQPAPSSLLAVLAVANPTAQWDAIRDYANSVWPGASAMLDPAMLTMQLSSLVGAESLAGIDMEKPLYVLAHDPERFAGGAFVLVAHVSDEGALKRSLASTPEVRAQMHRGTVAIGAGQTLAEGAPYALTTLQDEPVPAHPTVTVLMPAVMAQYGAQLSAMKILVAAELEKDPDSAQAKQFLQYLDTGMSESVALKLSFEVQSASVTANVVLAPRPDTAFATYVNKQAPAAFQLVERMPSGSILFAGRGDLFPPAEQDPAQQADRLRASLLKFLPADSAAAMAELFRAAPNYDSKGIIPLELGVSASVAKTGDSKMEIVYQVNDPAKLKAANDQFLAAISQRKNQKIPGFRIKPRRNAFRHRGVSAHGFSITLAEDLAPEIRDVLLPYFGGNTVDWAWAEFDGMGAIVIGAGGFPKLKGIIDRVKDKRAAALDPGAAAVIADAKARKESMVVGVDLSAIFSGLGLIQASASGSGWMVVGLGFADGVMSFRTTLPAATVRTIIELSSTGALPTP